MNRRIGLLLLPPVVYLGVAAVADTNAPQLYFLAGTAAYGADLPVSLYRVTSRGVEPEIVRRVADGMECVLADYERRILVVAAPAIAPVDFHVIQMDSPMNAIELHLPSYSDPDHAGGIYLLDLPRRGEAVALAMAKGGTQPYEAPSELTATLMEGPTNSTVKLPLDDLAYSRFSGIVGGGLPTSQQTPNVRGDPLRILIGDPIGHSAGIPRPDYFPPASQREGYHLVVNNDSIAVLEAASGFLDIFDKKAKAWRRTPVPFSHSRVRAFGPWLALIQSDLRGAPQAARGATGGTLLPESPGESKRASEKIGHRMTVDDLFRDGVETYPGELMVYNVASGAMFRISAGEGDSEIILATNDSVYYRVDDAIFRANIVSGTLATGVKIAEGACVPQAHWAFLAPTTN